MTEALQPTSIPATNRSSRCKTYFSKTQSKNAEKHKANRLFIGFWFFIKNLKTKVENVFGSYCLAKSYMRTIYS